MEWCLRSESLGGGADGGGCGGGHPCLKGQVSWVTRGFNYRLGRGVCEGVGMGGYEKRKAFRLTSLS